jgi:hypothetical protein
MPLRGLDDVDTFPQWTLELLFSDSKDGIKICLYLMPTPQCSRASMLTTIFFDGRLSKTISNSLRPSKTQPPTSRSFCSTIPNEPQLKRHTPPTQRLFPCTRYSIPKYWIDPIILRYSTYWYSPRTNPVPSQPMNNPPVIGTYWAPI